MTTDTSEKGLERLICMALGYLSSNDFEHAAAKETPRVVRNAHRPPQDWGRQS